MDGQVQVAGTIDHATVHQQQVDGSPGHRLELVDATGSRLRVAVPGALPDGLEAAEVAVVSGSMADGRLLASRILLPREPVPVQEVQVRTEDPATGLTGVMVISLIVWVGLFIYVFRVDRRVHRMEVS
jgi:CcmD family protein